MSRSASLGLTATALAAVALLAGPADATPETLKRAASNIVCAPLDLALSPVVGAKSVFDGIQYVDDSRGVRIAFALPGFAWNTSMVIGVGVIRLVTGLIELGPGLALIWSENDLDPLLAPVENSDGLVDIETPVLYIRFGMFYTS